MSFAPIEAMNHSRKTRVAVLIPCQNEAVAIPVVVRDFAAALPQARIYIHDNNSTDRTVAAATAAQH